MTVTTAVSAAQLPLEERAALTSGADFWTTKPVGEVPGFVLTDGPHGVRRQEASADSLGIAASAPATCFPPASGIGQSWDVDLINRVGAALGVEARELGVGVLLGPGVNIRRDPRCGRNFEYFSEDPILSGALGAAWVTGLQSEGVGASVKHFAANNVEADRMRASSDVDDRALREVYLRSFQRVVEDAKPWTVMASYNRINGVYATESRWLLTEVLRDEWGFDGVVVSDWGAVVDRAAALTAGLDLEMPASGRDDQVVAAVNEGSLTDAVVTEAAARMITLGTRVAEGQRPADLDADRQHALAREAASRSIVLLKNDGGLLPLKPAGRIAVIGSFAETPRYQGGGSSHVVPTRVDVPLDRIRLAAPEAEIVFARGFDQDGGTTEQLTAEAVHAATDADAVVLFLGLGERDESEGFDRDHIRLPDVQLQLLAAISAVQSRVVVVLSHGGVVELAGVAERAAAILDGALLGQAGGSAIADVLFGAVNPSGRLTETVPLRLQDGPAYLTFPGENSHVLYGESVYVGYRWFDAREAPVAFPFGHGLSYTRFEYSDLLVDEVDGGLAVTLTITNAGSVAGREVVQVYSGLQSSRFGRPPHELKAFATVDLELGESRRVETFVRRSDLAVWDTRVSAWVLEAGDYLISVGASSRDLRLTATIGLAAEGPRPPFSLDSTLGEVMADARAATILSPLLSRMGPSDEIGETLGMDIARMMQSFPLNRLGMMSAAPDQLEELLAQINAE